MPGIKTIVARWRICFTIICAASTALTMFKRPGKKNVVEQNWIIIQFNVRRKSHGHSRSLGLSCVPLGSLGHPWPPRPRASLCSLGTLGLPRCPLCSLGFSGAPLDSLGHHWAPLGFLGLPSRDLKKIC
jgi:hypothetical protein